MRDIRAGQISQRRLNVDAIRGPQDRVCGDAHGSATSGMCSPDLTEQRPALESRAMATPPCNFWVQALLEVRALSSGIRLAGAGWRIL